MAQSTKQITSADRIIGLLYTFLYHTASRDLMGLTIEGLLKFLPLLFSLLAWLVDLGVGWILVGIFLAILFRILYWRGRRAGYIRFIPEDYRKPPASKETIADDQRVEIHASGIFSVRNWERYVRQHSGRYWRVGMGDHAVMVDYPPNRYLYQFIQPKGLIDVVPGTLFSGWDPHPALEVSFLSNWGPDSPDVDFMFYSRKENGKQKQIDRRIYLAFEDFEHRALVWNSLVPTKNVDIDEPR
jgi:hypothetical protein